MKRVLTLALLGFTAACGAAPAVDEEADAAAAAEAAAEADATARAEAVLADLTTRYADPAAAIADGFMRDPSGMCVVAGAMGLPEEEGAMGVHYLHPARLALDPASARVMGHDGVINIEEPEVLVYEPQADGTERLVAVEYLVFEGPWKSAGHTEAPALLGQSFFHMVDDPATPLDEGHGFEAHYELHVWTARENPRGRYAEFNPAVSCANAPAPAMNM